MKKNIKKIIVTGSAGFIGYSLCEKLLEKGNMIIGIDNHNTYYDPKIKNARCERLLKYQNLTLGKPHVLRIDALGLPGHLGRSAPSGGSVSRCGRSAQSVGAVGSRGAVGRPEPLPLAAVALQLLRALAHRHLESVLGAVLGDRARVAEKARCELLEVLL